MPNYKGHLIGGAVAWGCLMYALQDVHPSLMVRGEWLIWCLLGSLFPDIDTHSKGQKLFYYGIGAALLYFLMTKQLQACAFLSMIAIIPLLVRHRGVFHNFWFLMILCIVPWWYNATYFPHYANTVGWTMFFFGAGVVSHLVLDFGFRKFLKNRK